MNMTRVIKSFGSKYYYDLLMTLYVLLDHNGHPIKNVSLINVYVIFLLKRL